jgi:hypothetical protein
MDGNNRPPAPWAGSLNQLKLSSFEKGEENG